ncbi:MAG: catechol 1,2-dioxygenase [Myxococcaceae bacterium]
MNPKIVETQKVKALLEVASGLTTEGGSPRAKQIVHRVLSDLFKTIEDLDVTSDEFWTAVNYINELGTAGETGLLAAGLGLEHFLDLRLDAKDEAAGIPTGTSRTIEGPLYVAGAPIAEAKVRLDDGREQGEVLVMQGTVRDSAGKPLAGAIVDVWHANTKGNYSYFDKSQSDFNLRRRIRSDAEGKYEFRSIMPSGYGCPPNGPTQGLLDAVGRHGQRPAHIHFFISAPGHRHLTTQINIAGDPLVHDDFAFATRDDLIPEVVRRAEPEALRAKALEVPFDEINFDFVLTPLSPSVPDLQVKRKRALQG